mmetsp:Transcript_19790/g.30479  ORF Transcript_19790/g.30479 Transcript_19790/m.30479 type:complete len:129 (+) Transcript_19790:105-491(+)
MVSKQARGADGNPNKYSPTHISDVTRSSMVVQYERAGWRRVSEHIHMGLSLCIFLKDSTCLRCGTKSDDHDSGRGLSDISPDQHTGWGGIQYCKPVLLSFQSVLYSAFTRIGLLNVTTPTGALHVSLL